MRTGIWMMGLLIIGLTVLTVQAGEEFYLVKIKGFDKRVEMQVLPAAEYKALDAQIKLEQKYLPKAIAETAKDWRADEMNKKSPFLGNKLMPRTIVGASKFASSEKANEALTKAEDQQFKKEEREATKNKNAKPSAEQLKMESDIEAAAALVKIKLDAMLPKAAAAEVKGVAAGVEAPGGAKVNAAVEKAAK